MAVVADAARDLIGKFTELPGTDDLLPELDHQLSELVRLAAEQMVAMRRFEALAEIQRHVRGRLSDLLNVPFPEITMDATVGAPANDHFPEI